jgi:hypothetical protein
MTRAALLALLLTLLVPAGASAATTIGSSLPASTGDTLECTDPGGCTFVADTIAGTAVRVPHDGVIVGWAARVPAGAMSPISLRVLRAAAGGQFTAAGSTSATPGADGAVAGTPSSYRRLTVRAGDLIGVDLDAGEEIGIATHPAFDSTSMTFAPVLGASETRAPDSSDSDDFEALFNATIEPDADRDGHGDETQDKCPQLAQEYARPCTDRPRLRLEAGRAGIGLVDVGQRIEINTLVAAPGHFVPNAVLVLPLPSALKPVAIRGTGFCTITGNTVTCPLGDLPSRRSHSVVVEAIALRPADTQVNATLTTALPWAPATSATAAVRVRTAKRCGLAIQARGGVGNGTTGGDRITGESLGDDLAGRAGDDCLTGLRGDDTLDGGDGDDTLDGGRGEDLARGGAGDDRLVGGSGADRLEAGPGKDSVDAVDGKRDVVRCGDGRDRARVDAVDSLAGCERVTRVPAKRR